MNERMTVVANPPSIPTLGDMVMVPRQATALMIQSGIVAHEACVEDGWGDNAMSDAWDAMLSAAPASPIPTSVANGETLSQRQACEVMNPQSGGIAATGGAQAYGASTSVNGAGERVRLLKWQEPHPSHSYPNWFARDYGIGFEARIDTSKPLLYGKFPLTINGNMVVEKFDTADAAKSYAQRNYDERILAALSPALDNTAVEGRGRFANDEAAKALYDTWSNQPGWVPWVERGNSTMQERARREVAL